MAYVPKQWKDLPDETTPIQASDLNHIEQGIGDLNTSVSNLNTSIGDLNTLDTTDKSSIVGAINEVYQNNVYSTDETVVGKWIDGKIIYKRTFNLGVLDNIGKEKLYTFDGNYYDVIKKESTIHSTGIGQTPLPVLDFVSNVYISDHVETNRDTKKLQIHLRRNNEEFYIGWTYILTVYYTKATD